MSWRGLLTSTARLGVLMAKPRVPGDFSQFRHHFRSGMTHNRMCGRRYTLRFRCFIYLFDHVQSWAFFFFHHSCGEIEHGGSQNSSILLCPVHAQNVYCHSSFCWLLKSSKQLVTGGKEIKMRAHGQADLRLSQIWFKSCSLVKLYSDFLLYFPSINSSELPTYTVRISL